MADFEMTLPQAMLVRDHIARLGYPSKWDRQLYMIAEKVIGDELTGTLARWREFKLNNPQSVAVEKQDPASPDAGGGHNFQPSR